MQYLESLAIWDHLNPCSKLEVPWTTQIIQAWITSVQGLVYFQFIITLKVKHLEFLGNSFPFNKTWTLSFVILVL